MPRARISDFSKGIWSVGPKDTSPPGTFRRLKGAHSLKTASIRSRDGSTKLFDLAAHSLFKFNGKRYSGVGDKIYEDATSIYSGLSGGRLAFVPAPATPAGKDCLFIAGGATLLKFNPVSNQIESWGIDPPPDGFSATPADKGSVQIDPFDDKTTWSASVAVLADEATIKQEGSNSMKVTLSASKQGSFSKAIAIDLETNISDEAHIECWVRIDFPVRVTSIQFLFDVSVAADFSTDYYSLSVVRADRTVTINQITPYLKWLTSHGANLRTGAVNNLSTDQIIAGEDSKLAQLTDIASAQSEAGQTVYPSDADVWTKLRLPKSLFKRSGIGDGTWKDVSAVKIIVQTNAGGSVVLYFDDIKVAGVNSLVGDYKYLITFANSVTGARSNPNPTPVEVDNLDRQKVIVSNLPTPSDSQVDTIELWRTLGGGTDYFLAGSFPVPPTTTSFEDDVADFPGVNSLATEASSFIDNTLLPTDNAPPADTYNDAFGPYNGVMFWTRDSAPGGEGRLYYSPVGRPESVVGFINISTSDDPCQKGVIWNRVPWVFTRRGICEIVGTDPFVPRFVEGAPGTTNPFTVIATPFGIIYEAEDGVRIFDGNISRLIAFNAISTLFRGEDTENIAAFSGIVACFARGEYLISDGNTLLALNITDETWREPGVPATALHFETDTKLVLASFFNKILNFEDNTALTDDGDNFPFDVEPPSFFVEPDKPGIVQRLFIEANTQGNILTPTLILTDDKGVTTETALPAFSTTTRTTTEYGIGRPARVAGVRLSGNVTHGVEVHDIALDLYVPEAAQVV